MKGFRKLAMSVGATGALLATMIGTLPAQAATTANNLGDLFVLSSLFANGNDSTGLLNNNSNADLGNIFVLDQLFGNGSLTRGTVSGSNRSSLGNLIILNQLFNNNNGLLGSGGGLLNNGGNNIGSLFVLDRLFSNNSNGIFSSSVLGGTTTNGTARAATVKPVTTTISTPRVDINNPNQVNLNTTTTAR